MVEATAARRKPENATVTGLILSIERGSMHDGPGIRTTIFLKGCPLRCRWCHNPESQSFAPELFLRGDRCSSCGACVKTCEHNCHVIDSGKHEIQRRQCTACGACTAVCPANALEIKGRRATVGDVLAEVEKDRAYYEATDGGVTVSGGEPFAQFDFCLALLREAKRRGLHACVETSGQTEPDRLREAAPFVDLFLLDYKATGEDLHRELTGVSSRGPLQALEFLQSIAARIVLRCPLIPDVNDSEEHLAAIAALARRNNAVEYVEIMPFHAWGAGKALSLGRTSCFAEKPSAGTEDAARWIERLHNLGCPSVKCAAIKK